MWTKGQHNETIVVTQVLTNIGVYDPAFILPGFIIQVTESTRLVQFLSTSRILAVKLST